MNASCFLRYIRPGLATRVRAWLLLVLAACSGASWAVPFDFVRIATGGDLETGGARTLTATPFFSGPVLNNAGQVAFFGMYEEGGTTRGGVWVGNGTQLQAVAVPGQVVGPATIASTTNPFDGSPELSAAGEVIFRTELAGFPVGFKHIATQLKPVGVDGQLVGGREQLGFSPHPAISSGGTIAYLPTLSGPLQSAVVINSTVAWGTGDMIEGQAVTGLLSPIAVNDAGTAAFEGFSGALGGIYTVSAGGNARVAGVGDTIDGNTFTAFDGTADINNGGAVAFYGNYAGGQGLFTQSGALVRTGDVIGGATVTGFFGSILGLGVAFLVPSINESGHTAFYGNFAGGSGLFTDDDLLLKVGDLLGSKTIAAFLDNPSINDDGSVAFGVAFTDGTRAFYRADVRTNEAAVPAPGTALLVLAGLVGFGALRTARPAPSA